MLAIEKSKSYRGKCTPNVLPCRINHNGPVNTSKRYWDPSTASDGKRVAYFRGRKLHGKSLRLPEGYRGIVLSKTDRILPPKTQPARAVEEAEDVMEEDEPDPEVKILEELSEFDEVVVWGHEALPDESADPYVRGIEEWIAMAGEIHAYKSDEKIASK